MTEVLHVLSDITRLRVYRTLLKITQEEDPWLCVAELSEIVQKPHYAVSRALGELKHPGLVVEKRQGKLVFYRNAGTQELRYLNQWILEQCMCQEPLTEGSINGDGSLKPGMDECMYDEQRLAWRRGIRVPGGEIMFQRPGNKKKAIRVLFVCVHNSARSQIAEAYLRHYGGGAFDVESAGLEPGILNPLVVEHLAGEGIDISGKQTKSVGDLYLAARTFDWVITVCDPAVEKNCPVFPGPVQRAWWPMEDPSTYSGSPSEQRALVARVARAIEKHVHEFILENQGGV